MTLPTDIIFPFRPEDFNDDDPIKRDKYMRDLVFTLTRSYQDTAQAVNGDIRDFTPTIVGSAVAGVGTYTIQTGIYLRQGLLVDYWFDVAWTAHTGTGSLGIGLPYSARSTLNQVWMNALSTSNIVLPAGRTWATVVCLNNLFTANVVACGSDVAESNVSMQVSGAMRGHLRYIGQQ